MSNPEIQFVRAARQHLRDPGGLNQVTYIGYSALGDVISTTDPNGNVSTSVYDGDRRLISSSTPGLPEAPGGRTVALTYDPDGRVLQTQVSANGSVLSTSNATYTLTGQPATAQDPNGNVTTYAYDVVDRLASATDAVGRTTTYSYDAMSRRLGVYNLAIQSTPLWLQGYTPDGLIGSVTDANSHASGYAYDGFDRLGTTTWPDTSTEVLSYDADSNVLTRKTRKGDTITLTYDTLNRLSTKSAPSEATVAYAYDQAGRMTGAGDTSATIVSPAASASYTSSYSYDALNRPLGVSWSPAPAQTLPSSPSSITFAHAYDATNRRVGQTASDNSWWSYPTAAVSIAYTPNSLNQYSAVGAVSPTYDGNGNLTSDGVFTYGYDAESRLTGITQGATSVSAYAFDAQARRKSSTVGSATTLFVTDADNRDVLEYDGTSGAIQAWSAYGLGPDDLLNRMNVGAASRQTLIPDIQGSIIGLLDSGGTLTKAGYQVFGENPTLTTAGPRYAGRRLDPETGGGASQPSGLYYSRARMYSPTWGRFLQPDPIGYGGGPNLYAYVNNDPLDLIDSSGLASDGPGADIGGGPFGLDWYRPDPNSRRQSDPTGFSIGGIQCCSWRPGGTAEGLGVVKQEVVLAAFIGVGLDDPAADVAVGAELGAEALGAADATVPEGIVYLRTDVTGGVAPYGGQSINEARYVARQAEHARAIPNSEFQFTIVDRANPGTELDIAEHNFIQELTAGVAARRSPAVSNLRDPVGAGRRLTLGLPEPR